jgi:hypothetical protein
LNPIQRESYFTIDKDTGERKFLHMQFIASRLVQQSCFKNFKVFYKVDQSYLYLPKQGVYMEINNVALEILLRRFTQEASIVDCMPMTSISRLIKEIKAERTAPKID